MQKKRIKIYRYYDDTPQLVAACFVSLDDDCEIYDCKPDPGEDFKDAIEVIKETLEHELKQRGIEETVKHYKGQLRGPIVPINGVDYSWTIEEVAIMKPPRVKEKERLKRPQRRRVKGTHGIWKPGRTARGAGS